MSGNVVDLSCGKCGSNHLRFPAGDSERVTCEDCGADGRSLGDVKLLIAGGSKVVQPEKRAERRRRHTSEVEVSQSKLRKSVAVTDELVVASDKMLRRHRKECEQDDP